MRQVLTVLEGASGSLPDFLYRLLDPAAPVELPPAGAVSLRESDNRELDKLVGALGRSKATWRRALALHEWLLQIGYCPDDRLCTTLIRVCAQHGQAATALSLYDWMRAPRADGGAGLTPTVFTYTAAMRAALTGNMPERALGVWDDALAARCDVDCRLCTTLIEVCGRKGDTERALAAYSQMRDAPRDSRMAPSVHAFTAAMRAASEGGRWEAALAIWDDMQKAGCKPTGACLTQLHPAPASSLRCRCGQLPPSKQQRAQGRPAPCGWLPSETNVLAHPPVPSSLSPCRRPRVRRRHQRLRQRRAVAEGGGPLRRDARLGRPPRRRLLHRPHHRCVVCAVLERLCGALWLGLWVELLRC